MCFAFWSQLIIQSSLYFKNLNSDQERICPLYSAVCKSLRYIYPVSPAEKKFLDFFHVSLKKNRVIKISLFRCFAVSRFRCLVTPIQADLLSVIGKF